MKAYDDEVENLERELSDGIITLKEFNKLLGELEGELGDYDNPYISR